MLQYCKQKTWSVIRIYTHEKVICCFLSKAISLISYCFLLSLLSLKGSFKLKQSYATHSASLISIPSVVFCFAISFANYLSSLNL